MKRLAWDSDFFEADVYRILFMDAAQLPPLNLVKQHLARWLNQKARLNLFAEVPSEAIEEIRILQQLGFSLIETRLNYHHTLGNLLPSAQKARTASLEDMAPLKAVASGAVNRFDKYHADPFFRPEDASRYLETYIANCLKGFAEVVFVPDLPAMPASFVALSRLNDAAWKEAAPVYRIPLTACLPQNKGWHLPLCLAALEYAKKQGAACLLMTTQSTNRAVVHNCEKLGFKLGSCTHIFSLSHI